jgi:hypothetical protein
VCAAFNRRDLTNVFLLCQINLILKKNQGGLWNLQSRIDVDVVPKE